MDPPKRSYSYTGINPLSMLVLQNKTFEQQVLDQAEIIFDLISRAILNDQNHIEFDQPIYAANQLVLQNKGYLIFDRIIGWKDFLPEQGQGQQQE